MMRRFHGWLSGSLGLLAAVSLFSAEPRATLPNIWWETDATGIYTFAGSIGSETEFWDDQPIFYDWELWRNSGVSTFGSVFLLVDGYDWGLVWPSICFTQVPGWNHACSNDGIALGFLPAGLHTVEFVADFGNEIQELTEADNQVVRSIDVQRRQPSGHWYAITPPFGTWEQMQQVAQDFGGYLATITSPSEQRFIENSFLWGSGGAEPYWIGLSDAAIEGAFRWYTGEMLAFTNWEQNQPSHSGAGEDYVVMNQGYSKGSSAWRGMWNDVVDTAGLYHGIIEWDSEPPEFPGVVLQWADPVSGGRTRWTTGSGANGHTYEAFWVAEGIEWSVARAFAESRGGYLATVVSAAENTFLFSLTQDWRFWQSRVQGSQTRWMVGSWLGAYQALGSVEPSEGWKWVTGEPFSWSHWKEGQPNQSGGRPQDFLHFTSARRNSTLEEPSAWWNDGEECRLPSFVVEYSLPEGDDPQVEGCQTTHYASVPDPQNLAFAPDGTLYVGRDTVGFGGGALDYLRIWRVAAGGSPVTEFGSKPISDPDALIVDSIGSISGTPNSVLVGGDSQNYPTKWEGLVSSVSPTGAVSVVFGPSSDQVNPTDFVFDPEGRLLFTDYNRGTIMWTRGETPQVLCEVPKAAYLAIDVLGRIVVSTATDEWLWVYDLNGRRLAGLDGVLKPESPLAQGPGGFWGTDIYGVSDSGELLRLAPNGSSQSVGTGFSRIQYLTFGPDLALYCSDPDNTRILRIGYGIPGACDYSDRYPDAGNQLGEPDRWGFYTRECTSYVAWRLNQEVAGFGASGISFNNWLWPKVTGDSRNRWSDAWHWRERADQLGVWIAQGTPRPGDVAHWGFAEQMGGLGHVAFVEAVYPDGTVDLTEYNRDGTHAFGSRCGVPVTSVPRFIRVLPFLRRPDLVVDRIEFAPASVAVGGTISVTLSLSNHGPGAAIASKARIRLSEDRALTRYDWPLSPLDVDVPSISAGQSVEVSLSVHIPAGTPAGQYYLGAFADADDRTEQSDLTNDAEVSTTRLTVTAPGILPPEILQQPVARSVNQSEQVAFSVEATGTGPLSYQWLHAGQPIAGATGSSLFYDSVSQSQAGVYQVRVSNAGGTSKSTSVSLTVLPGEQPMPVVTAGRGVLAKVGPFDPSWKTIVITHGWQMSDTYNGLPPEWVKEMAQAIRLRLSREGVEDVNVLTFAWPEAFTGNYLSLADLADLANNMLGGGVAWLWQVSKFVLAFNQSMSFAFSEGEVLAQQLEHEFGWDYAAGLHLIGHSHGSIVNAAAVNVLPSFRGIQMTILDVPVKMNPVNVQDFQQLLRPYPVVEWVENYVGMNRSFPPAVGDVIPGSATCYVDENHTGVHAFYHSTITDQTWQSSGFYFSNALGAKGGYSDRPAPKTWLSTPPTSRPVLQQAISVAIGVGDGLNFVAGVARDEALAVGGYVKRAVVKLFEASPEQSVAPAQPGATEGSRTLTQLAYDMVLPDDATRLAFDYLFSQPGDGDWLEVRFNDDLLFGFRGDSFYGTNFHTASLPISRYAGQPGVFTFSLLGVNAANAELILSNLRVESEPRPRLELIAHDAARVRLRISGELGSTYVIQASEDLREWQNVHEVRLTEPTATWTDLQAGEHPHRFYRVALDLNDERLAPQAFVAEDFTSGDGGFTVQNSDPAPPGPWVYDRSYRQWGAARGNDACGTPNHSVLTSPAYEVPESGEVSLSLTHRYSFEGDLWDGGQLRISVNGGEYTTVPPLEFTVNGYAAGVLQGHGILEGEPAFNGESPGYDAGVFVTSAVVLGGFSSGDTISLRFVAAWDECTTWSVPNWVIQQLQLLLLAGPELP